MPACFCVFQCVTRSSFPVCSNSFSEISFLKYFSEANFNSRKVPILGNPITDVCILSSLSSYLLSQ